MSRIRSYQKDYCYNPECIKGGAPADYGNPKCYLDPGNINKVFCSPECGEYYFDNIDDIEKDNRIIQKIRTRKCREKKKEEARLEDLADAICAYGGGSIDRRIIVRIIKKLELSSPYVP